MSELQRDNIEVRLHKDGTLDEIVIDDPHTGQCLFHLEQMDDHYYWMRAYGTTQDLVAYISATIGKVRGEPLLEYEGGKQKFLGYKEEEGAKVVGSYEWEDAGHENDSHPDYATPKDQRQTQVAEMINKFGVACVLQVIAEIYSAGRKAEHEQALIADLLETRQKFLDGDRAYMDARIKEMYGQDT